MRVNQYSMFVHKLIKPMSERDNLAHMAMGLSGEAGEVTDLIKKSFAYDKALDKGKVVEELGDVLFYLTGMAHAVGSSLYYVMQLNQEKLNKRYPTGYTDNAAIARRDVKTGL